MSKIFCRLQSNYVAHTTNTSDDVFIGKAYYNDYDYVISLIMLLISLNFIISVITGSISNSALNGFLTFIILSFVALPFFIFKRKDNDSVNSFPVEKPDSISSHDWDTITLGMIMRANMANDGDKWFTRKDSKTLNKLLKTAKSDEKKIKNNEQKIKEKARIDSIVQNSTERFDAYIEKKLDQRREIVK